MPSPVDARYECVPAPAGVAPPPGGTDDAAVEAANERLCPDGYVPRLKRRTYELRGKVVRRAGPAERRSAGPDSTARP